MQDQSQRGSLNHVKHNWFISTCPELPHVPNYSSLTYCFVNMCLKIKLPYVIINLLKIQGLSLKSVTLPEYY